MKNGIDEIKVEEDTTVRELMDELRLSSAPVLVEVGGEIFYPDEIGDRELKKGDKVAFISLIAGG